MQTHIKLISYSIVKLAAQVLSFTVSNVLSSYASPDSAETAKFCSLMATFFDFMNIRDINSHKCDLKPSLIPFSSTDNPRFLGCEMYFYSILITGFIPSNTVKVIFLEMQKIKYLFHSNLIRVGKFS